MEMRKKSITARFGRLIAVIIAIICGANLSRRRIYWIFAASSRQKEKKKRKCGSAFGKSTNKRTNPRFSCSFKFTHSCFIRPFVPCFIHARGGHEKAHFSIPLQLYSAIKMRKIRKKKIFICTIANERYCAHFRKRSRVIGKMLLP